MTNWKNLGIAKEPDRIRLGGVRVRSIDGMKAPSVARAEFRSAEPEFVRDFDWQRIATEASLSRLEAQLFRLHWQDGTPVATCHQPMGITCHQAKGLYRSIIRKLRMGGPAVQEAVSTAPARDSRRIVYRDRLSGGARPWALAPLGGPFREIMEREKKYITFIPQQDRQIVRPNVVFCAGVLETQTQESQMKEETKPDLLDLQIKLKSELVEFDKLVVDSQAIDSEIRKCEARVETLKKSTVPRRGDAIRIVEAERLLDEARARLDECTGKITAQQALVEGIENQIQSNRFSEFTKDLAAPKKEFLDAVEALVRAAVKVGKVFDQHHISGGRLGETGLVFDQYNKADIMEREIDRTLSARLLGTAIEMNNQRMIRGYGFVEKTA